MYFERVYDRRLAQAAYVVGCQATGEAMVIDPARDIRPYLEIARREELAIRQVVETHVHADFLSGSRELAAQTGAALHLSAEGGERWRYRFAHEPLHDGDVIHVGAVRLDVLHTPGHTPEHLSFLLYDPAAGDPPRMVFTGDALFVGDIGRPDLLEAAAGMAGTSEAGARQMYATVQRLAELPDHVVVWPGHGAGSACGKALGAVPVSTIGYERRANWAFGEPDIERFVARLLDGQPAAPRYFAQMKRLNLDRPRSSLRIDHPVIPELEGSALRQLVESGSIQLIDVRPTAEFAAGHVAGSVNIPLDDGMVTWFGWVLDYGQPIVIVAPIERREEVATALASIGFDDVLGAVTPESVPPQLLRTDVDIVAGSDESRIGAMTVFDVRADEEVSLGAIPGARRLPITELKGRLNDVPADEDVLFYCQSGYRSAIAASMVAAAGRGRPATLDGGYLAWQNQRYPQRV